jgi:uncharacterized membrane protein
MQLDSLWSDGLYWSLPITAMLATITALVGRQRIRESRTFRWGIFLGAFAFLLASFAGFMQAQSDWEVVAYFLTAGDVVAILVVALPAWLGAQERFS